MNRRFKSSLISVLGLLTGLGGAPVLIAQDQAASNPNIRLPTSDSQYKSTKGYVEEDPIPGYQHASEAAYEAFRDLKYGVRIHWGIYSIQSRTETSWPYLHMSYAEKQAYDQLYKTWNPTKFNADEWMRLFKDSGMKMFAFTTKHHEGFSMYDTHTRVHERVNWTAPGGPALEDCDLAYSIMETPFKRDIVKELCDSARAHGIKIDLYFSNPDWYDADFRPYCNDPITTAAATENPGLYGNAPVSQRRGSVYYIAPDPTPQEEERMMARYRQQLTELLTNYGEIDMLCLDMWLGKKVWPQTRDTMLALRKLQPDVMLRARGIGNYGDYYTPEKFVPGSKENTDMPWFVIYPLAKDFAYDPNPAHYKGGEWIVRTLVDAVAKGGNFMVGIGPDKDGVFPAVALQNLKVSGDWLKTNGEGIYATRPVEGDLWKEGKEIRYTQTKDHQTLYAFTLHWQGPTVTFKNFHPRENSPVYLMGYPKPLDWKYTPEGGTVIQMPADLQDPAKQKPYFVCGFRIQR